MNIYSELALAEVPHMGPEAALDHATSVMRTFAPECIPDVGPARAALTAWGISFTPGERLQSLVTSTPTLAASLPKGWVLSRRGGGGHMELLDARGASRLRWYIHGWEPVSMSVNERFHIPRAVNLSPTDAVLHVMDGPTVIHTVPVQYPHARINRPDEDGTPYYKTGYAGEDEGWTREMGAANYRALEDANRAGIAWLDANRAGHQDALASWGL